MRRPVRCLALPGLAIALAVLVSTGCGAETTTVAGTVTYRGKPVSNGSVVFYCPDKQIVRGIIGADGTYSVPNVPSGSAVVTVQTHAKVPAGMRLDQKLPNKQQDTPIHPVVDSSDTTRMVIPTRYALPEESGLSVVIDRGLVTYDIDLKP